jgi:anti-sigma B factor antagonist
MSLEVRTVDDVTILAPRGMLLGGKETDELQDTIKQLDQAGNKKLLINLGHTSHVSSMGLAVLFRARASYVRRGGCVKICSVDRRIRQLFILVKLPLVYGDDLHETEPDALAGFREPVTS